MKNATPDQITQYREHGFVVIPEFLDADELERWRHATDEAVDEGLRATAADALEHDSYYARVFTQCQRLADTHVGMAELILDPRLGEIAATLAGIDGIRGLHDQALIKPPYGNPAAGHP